MKDLIEVKGEIAPEKKEEGYEVFNKLIKEAEKESEEICRKIARI